MKTPHALFPHFCLYFFVFTNLLQAQNEDSNKWEVGVDFGIASLLNYKVEGLSEKENKHAKGLLDGITYGAEINYKLHPKHHIGLTFKGVSTSEKSMGLDIPLLFDLVLNDINKENLNVLYLGPSYQFNLPVGKGKFYVGTSAGIVFYRGLYKFTTSSDDDPKETSTTKSRANRHGFYSRIGYNRTIGNDLTLGFEVGFMYADMRKITYMYDDDNYYESTPLNPLIFDNLSARILLKKDVQFKNIFKKR